MTSYEYKGPADSVMLPDGKTAYHPGDSIPLSLAQKAAMEKAGHRFADTDEMAAISASQNTPAAPDQRPRGDRGEVLDVPDHKPAAAAPAPAPAPAPAK